MINAYKYINKSRKEKKKIIKTIWEIKIKERIGSIFYYIHMKKFREYYRYKEEQKRKIYIFTRALRICTYVWTHGYDRRLFIADKRRDSSRYKNIWKNDDNNE